SRTCDVAGAAAFRVRLDTGAGTERYRSSRGPGRVVPRGRRTPGHAAPGKTHGFARVHSAAILVDDVPGPWIGDFQRCGLRPWHHERFFELEDSALGRSAAYRVARVCVLVGPTFDAYGDPARYPAS